MGWFVGRVTNTWTASKFQTKTAGREIPAGMKELVRGSVQELISDEQNDGKNGIEGRRIKDMIVSIGWNGVATG